MTEILRLAALQNTALLDSVPEERFDRLTRLASRALGTDIALISLIDKDRQWFKSRQGLDVAETPRDQAFCDYAIESEEVMVVPDATQDPRFANNPLVTGDPNIAFYAGAPLITKEGYALGTLCVIDNKPREDFGLEDKQVLMDIAATVMAEIEANAQSQIIEDLNVVNEELQHRMGNMYAHISSLISMMGRAGGDPKNFVRNLRNRITTLAQTQALIASHRYQSAPLSAIFETTVSPLLTDENRARVRFLAEGDLDISARGAFTLTLMLNELVTNALKHGALKDLNGTVDFSWLALDDEMISFKWNETSTSIEESQSEHKGFGSQILGRIVPMDFQGIAEREMLPTGLSYTVSARRERVKESMTRLN